VPRASLASCPRAPTFPPAPSVLPACQSLHTDFLPFPAVLSGELEGEGPKLSAEGVYCLPSALLQRCFLAGASASSQEGPALFFFFFFFFFFFPSFFPQPGGACKLAL